MLRRPWLAVYVLPVVIALVGTVAAVALHGGESVHYAKRGPLYQVEAGDDLFQFDAVWREETLWHRDSATGGWMKIQDPPAGRLDGYRKALLLQAGYGTVDDIPVEGERAIEALKSLGYI